MPFKLLSSQDELDCYTIYFNSDDFSPWPLNENFEPVAEGRVIEFEPDVFRAQNGVACEKLIFAMSRLTTGQWTNIQNTTFTTSRRGKQKQELGSAGERKVLACCKKVMNIEIEGNASGDWVTFSPKILSDLPLWVMDNLLDYIDKINNLDDTDRKD